MSDDNNKCAYCGADPLPEKDQPYPGLHCYTIIYYCGTEEVYAISGEGSLTDVCCLDDKPKVKLW